MEFYELTDREKLILRNVIHQFILTANPVGSRYIAKKYNLNISSATIRNIMADLEDSGFLNHPHTSAGRIPTDKGYRFYVDSLMDPPVLENTEKEKIKKELLSSSIETEELLKRTANVLGAITNQLACVSLPKLDKSHLLKIQIVNLSTTRILVVITTDSGIVKTITLEIESELSLDELPKVEMLLNEKLSGLTFSEIRKTFHERIKDYDENQKPIIRLFLDSVDKIFKDDRKIEKSIIAGIGNLIQQPEFGDQKNIKSIIELVEDKEVIIHIMDSSIKKDEKVIVKIGEETDNESLTDYSLITTTYSLGDTSGTLGIIGPKRMEYSKTIAAIVYIAEQLSKELKRN